MADPTVPWGIPLFDDNTPFAPIQAPFNSQSAALNDALTAGAFQPYATKALLDAAPGTRVGQHASVYADGTVANNGDYRWSGTVWDTSVTDTGWVNLVLVGATVADGLTPQIRRINGVAYIIGRLSQSGSIGFQIPSGFAAKNTLRLPAMANSSGTATTVLVIDPGAGNAFTVAGQTINLGHSWAIG